MKRALFALLMAASLVAVAQDPKVKPSAKPAPAPAAKTAPAPASAIVANKDSKIFHRADCKSVGKMKEAHKMPFASAAEAQKAGYKPCKVCKP